MENCYLKGKLKCTYDLKDENGLYYEELVLDWKQAAADRRLTCVDCGAPVYLAAGPIMEPYFAHYDLENCDYGSGQESEELKKGKRLLYHLLKRSFPCCEVQARYRMENGLYTTFYCRTEEGIALAIDYRLVNNSLEKYRLRDTFYQSKQIMPIYILGKRQEKDTKQIDWYQSMIQSSMGYLAFLDTDKETLTLKKSFGYRLGNQRKFKYCNRTYLIKELALSESGQFLCDFSESCFQIEQQIQEEKQQYKKLQNKLVEMKELRQRQENIERERQEAYRRAKLLEESKIQGYADLNPVLLERCRRMIEEGNAHLVSKKYYDAIMIYNQKG